MNKIKEEKYNIRSKLLRYEKNMGSMDEGGVLES